MNIAKKSVSRRPTEEQKLKLIEFLEENPDIANDRVPSIDAPKLKATWDAISMVLNSLGGTIKSSDKWRKFWMDLKRYMKEKCAAKLKSDNSDIGYSKRIVFNDLENRIIRLIKCDNITIENVKIPGISENSEKSEDNNISLLEPKQELQIETIFFPDINISNTSRSSTPVKRRRKNSNCSQIGEITEENLPENLINLEKEKLTLKKKKLLLEERKVLALEKLANLAGKMVMSSHESNSLLKQILERQYSV